MSEEKSKMGKYKRRNLCRFCGKKNLYKFLDLGKMPHAGDFLKKRDVGKENLYPLRIYLCKDCGLVQILDIIPPSVLFKDYHYFSSVSLADHFQKYANYIKNRIPKNSFIVEIGSNDGALLHPLKQMGHRVIGVDPAKNVAKFASKRGVKTIVDFFDDKIAQKITKKYGQADVVLANNVLAHIDDIQKVFKGITRLLKKDGIIIFEVHYFPDLIIKMQYDFFYGEHLSYFSLWTIEKFLEKYNIEIFDVKRIKTHSGSIRVFAKFKRNRNYKISQSVMKLIGKEKMQNINSLANLDDFAKRVFSHREKLIKVLNEIKKGGHHIAGYGASGRANTLLNFCGIDSSTIDYIVDDSPERQGKLTPGTHIPIVPASNFGKDKIKYVVLLAWNYKDEILNKEKAFLKRGGKFVIPLPKIRFYENEKK